MRLFLIIILGFLSCSVHAQAWKDAVLDDEHWDPPLRWLEREHRQYFPAIKGVILPLDMPQSRVFINSSSPAPLMASFYPQMQVNGETHKVCMIGRSRNADWAAWLDVAPTPGHRSWIYFWLLAHEWGHCLDGLEGVHTKTLKEQQMGEQRADVFATLLVLSESKDDSWMEKLIQARSGDAEEAVHFTKMAMAFVRRLKVMPDNMKQAWELSKMITERVNQEESTKVKLK